jgi:hypothetical protein
MNNLAAAVARDGHFRVRPAVLIGCGILSAAVVLPMVFEHRYYAQMGLLLLASACPSTGIKSKCKKISFAMELMIKIFLISAFIATPSFAVLAYRGWLKHGRQAQPRWRSDLGLASILLTFMDWLVFALLIIAAQARILVINADTWDGISIVVAILSASLGFALTRAARIYAIAAGALMATIQIILILTGR